MEDKFLNEMGNKAEAPGIGRNVREHMVQPYAMSFGACYSVLIVKVGGNFWSFHEVSEVVFTELH